MGTSTYVPTVCYGLVDNCFPGSPPSLVLLAHSWDRISHLLQSSHHQLFPVPFRSVTSFEPSLNWLQPPNYLPISQLTDGTCDCLFSLPLPPYLNWHTSALYSLPRLFTGCSASRGYFPLLPKRSQICSFFLSGLTSWFKLHPSLGKEFFKPFKEPAGASSCLQEGRDIIHIGSYGK